MAKTLRDEFAMAAMAGMHARVFVSDQERECATAAYQMANAMMEERKKHLTRLELHKDDWKETR